MKKMKGKGRTAEIVSTVYFSGMILLLIWNLLHCKESSWEYREAYLQSGDPGSAETVELRDDSPVRLYCEADETGAVSRKSKVCGVSLLQYDNNNELRFAEETVRADLYAGNSGEKIGTAEMLLRNQTPFPEDGTQMYLALPEKTEAPAGEPLTVEISSEGLRRNGITFSGVSASSAEGERFPLARICYANTSLHPLGPLLRFLIGTALGIFCLAVYRSGRVQGVFRKPAGTVPSETTAAETIPEGKGAVVDPDPIADAVDPGLRTEAEKEAPLPAGPRSGRPDRLLSRYGRPASVVLLAVLGLLLLVYTYRTAVRDTAESASAEYLVTGRLEKSRILLPEGAVLRQRVFSVQDDLEGLGIRLRTGEEDSDSSGSLRDAVLTWRILQEDGTVLGEGRKAAEDLAPVRPSLSETTSSEEVLEASENYLLLPLEQPVSGVGNSWIDVELSVEKGELPVQVSEGGNGELQLDGQSREAELSLLGVYRNNGFLKKYFLILSVLLLLFTAAAFVGARVLRLQLAGIYLLCALTMGFLFSFVTPAYTMSDERTHIETAYALSNRFLGIQDDSGPERLMKRTCDVDTSIRNTMPVSVDRYRETLQLGQAAWKEQDGRELTSVYARNALGNATAFTYFPVAAGMTAARIAGRNMITMIMAGRWMNLIACAFLINLAIRKMPVGAPCMAVIALFPRTVQLMASCSYDGMILAGSFLFIACCLHAVCGGRFTASDLAVLLAAGAHTILCKGGVYLPLIGIVLLVPLMRQGMSGKARRQWFRTAWVLCLGAVVLFVLGNAGAVFSILLRKPGTVTLNVNARTLFSMGDILGNPGILLKLVSNTFQIRTAVLVEEMVCPSFAKQSTIVYAFLFLAFLGVCRKSGESSRFTPAGRVLTLALTAASSGLIALSMLLAYTPVESNYIQGIQGRYFLPLLPLVFCALENSRFCREKGHDTSLLLAADLLLAVEICQILIGCFGGL